jgi:hypothetical protein
VTELIDRRGLLYEPQRMARPQDLHGDADLDAPGAGGDGAGDAQRRQQQRALRLEVQFGEPDRMKPDGPLVAYPSSPPAPAVAKPPLAGKAGALASSSSSAFASFRTFVAKPSVNQP